MTSRVAQLIIAGMVCGVSAAKGISAIGFTDVKNKIKSNVKS